MCSTTTSLCTKDYNTCVTNFKTLTRRWIAYRRLHTHTYYLLFIYTHACDIGGGGWNDGHDAYEVVGWCPTTTRTARAKMKVKDN